MIIRDTAFYENSAVIKVGSDFAQGLACGMLLTGNIMSSRYGAKVRAFKRRMLGKRLVEFKRKMLDNKK